MPTLALLFALAGCAPQGAHSGRLLSALSEEPLVAHRVQAKAVTSPQISCQVRETLTDGLGDFHFDDLCPEPYVLSSGEAAWVVAGDTDVDGTVQSAMSVDYAVWLAPPAPGVFRVAGQEIQALRTFSPVSQETVLGGTATVRYPEIKPLRAPTIAPGGYLVIAGGREIKKLEIEPLLPDTGVRRFSGGVTIEDHVYIGVAFDSDRSWRLVDGAADEAHVRNVVLDDRPLRYVGHAALAPGMYAVLGKKDRRTYVVEFTEP